MFLGLGAVAGILEAVHVSMQGTSGAATGLVAYGGAFVVFLFLPSLMLRRLRLAQLRRSKIPFDRDAYFTALDGRAANGALSIEVDFKAKDTPDVSNLTMVPTSSVRPSPGAITIVSPAMRTVRAGWFGTYHYNGELAAWFESALRGVLEALHRRHEITSLRVAFVPELAKTAVAEPVEEAELPRMSIAQKKGTIRWLVGGSIVAVALAIAAGLTDHLHYFTGLLAGLAFTITLALGAGTVVLFQLRGRNPAGLLLRRPLEWITTGIPYSAVAIFILLLGAPTLWAIDQAGPAHTWYRTWFFVSRAVIYVMVWSALPALIEKASAALDATGSHAKLDKLAKTAPRLLTLLGASLLVVVLDWVIGIHREALARWLAPLAASNLIAGGIAAAVGVGCLVVQRLEGLKLVGSSTTDHRAYAARWLVGASLVWLVTAAATAGATLASPDAPRAAWEAHALLGAWRGWSIANIALHVVPLFLLAAPAARRSAAMIATCSLLLILGHAATAAQLVLPAARGGDLPTWIELGGFATALVGIWVALFQSMGERVVVARRAPSL